MAQALKSAHAEISEFSDESKVAFYKRTYANVDHSANEAAVHFYAFGVAFLGFSEYTGEN